MNWDKNALLLYAVTDRAWLNGSTLESQVRQTIEGGATMVQLREKHLQDELFWQEAVEIQKLCQEYRVPFIVNDSVEIARKIHADGVHVGQKDMAAGDVRKLLEKDQILGVSAQTVEQAVLAEEQGADYLGVGAVFHTGTKADAQDVSFETLKQICSAVRIPVVAIGGITKDNVALLKGSGICGVAVVSAIFAAQNIREATQELRNQVKEMVAI